MSRVLAVLFSIEIVARAVPPVSISFMSGPSAVALPAYRAAIVAEDGLNATVGAVIVSELVK